MAIVITDILAEWGAFYKDGGQGLKDIMKKIMRMSETEQKMFTVIPTNNTRLESSNVAISKVLQGFQKQFTPYGTTTFKPILIDLHKLKIDWEEEPDEIEQSWLGFMATNDLSRKDWPLIRYIINELILAKAEEDWELDGIYHGEKTAIVAGTVKPIEGAINGIRFVINKHITDGDTDPIVMGALPTDAIDAVEYVEKFARTIPKHIRPKCGPIALPDSFYDLYIEGRGKIYNQAYKQVEDLEKVQNMGMSVVGLASHEGEQKIWTTPKGNAVIGVKKSSNQRIFKIEESKRMVSAMTDFYKGLGYLLPEYLFTNDQDL